MRYVGANGICEQLLDSGRAEEQCVSGSKLAKENALWGGERCPVSKVDS